MTQSLASGITRHGEDAAGAALLLVGHGTRSAAGVAAFTDFVTAVGSAAPVPVAGGFIELSAPPLADAVAGLVEAGARELVAVPVVLSPAGHAKGDIPAALARERLRHPGTSYRYGRPLWPHGTILALLEARLDAVLPREERAETAVLLVGRGSTDPDANAEVVKVARLLWEGRGLAMVEPAFISLARPGVAEGLRRCRQLGAEQVVVLPYFLFPGVLPDRVVAEASEFAAGDPGLRLRSAELLGNDPALVELVWQRYHEALRGDIRMNCDTCLYRTAFPGHEARVGAPQRPHHHPDDPAGHEHGHGHGHEHGHGRGHGHVHDPGGRA